MKIFITGASGYIGGSVATKLRDAGHEVLGLVRTEAKAELLKQRGIESVIGCLDDVDILTNAACRTDAVIQAASADHFGAVGTLVAALERSGKLLIHTSGSGIVADDARGEYASSVVFADDTSFEPVPLRRARVDGAIWSSVKQPRQSSQCSKTRLVPASTFSVGSDGTLFVAVRRSSCNHEVFVMGAGWKEIAGYRPFPTPDTFSPAWSTRILPTLKITPSENRPASKYKRIASTRSSKPDLPI